MADPQPSLYDPSLVVVTLGPFILSGFADGSFLKVTRDVDAFTKTVGAGGDVARTRSANKAGSIQLTLMQSSASNDILSAQAVADEKTGAGALPLMVKDLSGRSLAAAPSAWVKKMADFEAGKDLGSRVWMLDCGRLELFTGGN